ncbi:hypothetical protein ACSZNM_14665 [Aeromonas hydrophila]
MEVNTGFLMIILNRDHDIELDVIDISIEVGSQSPNEGDIVLFTCKVGCVGWIDPIPIKYFAFQYGVKNALGCEETVRCQIAFVVGGPIPGRNVKKHNSL